MSDKDQMSDKHTICLPERQTSLHELHHTEVVSAELKSTLRPKRPNEPSLPLGRQRGAPVCRQRDVAPHTCAVRRLNQTEFATCQTCAPVCCHAVRRGDSPQCHRIGVRPLVPLECRNRQCQCRPLWSAMAQTAPLHWSVFLVALECIHIQGKYRDQNVNISHPGVRSNGVHAVIGVRSVVPPECRICFL